MLRCALEECKRHEQEERGDDLSRGGKIETNLFGNKGVDYLAFMGLH